jgi:hypothetical protein
MTYELKNELEYLTDIYSMRMIIAKQLIKNGYNYKSFTEEAKEIGLSQIASIGIGNAIIDIEKEFINLDKIPDLKLENL